MKLKPFERLYTIDAPHFNAGCIAPMGQKVTIAAPIIHYMVGWDYNKIALYTTKKGWKMTFQNIDVTEVTNEKKQKPRKENETLSQPLDMWWSS